MTTSGKLVIGIAFVIMIVPAAFAQHTKLRILQPRVESPAVIGQVMEARLVGVAERRAPSLPIERFQVIVRQNDRSFSAVVRGAMPVLMSVDEFSGFGNQPPDVADKRDFTSQLKPACVVAFTVPDGLVPGNATATIIYEGAGQSDDLRFKIVDVPPSPHIVNFSPVISFVKPKGPPTPEELRRATSQALSIRPGLELELLVFPLIDPETPDSGLLITFKQGSVNRQVRARVTRLEAVRSEAEGLWFSPSRYQVLVQPPNDLSEGPVEIEARLLANGKVSEPGVASATVVPAAHSDYDLPRIVGIDNTKVGPGQALQLQVTSVSGTDPSKLMAIFEHDSVQVSVKPEISFASRNFGTSAPHLLYVRVPANMNGKVTVTVVDQSEQSSSKLPEGVEVEISREVLPPVISKITEASQQDILMLTAMRDEALQAGHDFSDYDPGFRYVTIQATGIDYSPTHVRIQFFQGSRSFTLSREDFALSLGNRLVVRVPQLIKPGQVLLTIQNIGFNDASEPVRGSVEITQAARKR